MKEVRLTIFPLVLAILVGFGLFILLQLIERALWVLVLLALVLAAARMPIVRVLRSIRLPPGGWRLPKALVVLRIYVSVAVLLALTTSSGQWWLPRSLPCSRRSRSSPPGLRHELVIIAVPLGLALYGPVGALVATPSPPHSR